MTRPRGDSNARTQLRRLVLYPTELQGLDVIMIPSQCPVNKGLSFLSASSPWLFRHNETRLGACCYNSCFSNRDMETR